MGSLYRQMTAGTHSRQGVTLDDLVEAVMGMCVHCTTFDNWGDHELPFFDDGKRARKGINETRRTELEFWLRGRPETNPENSWWAGEVSRQKEMIAARWPYGNEPYGYFHGTPMGLEPCGANSVLVAARRLRRGMKPPSDEQLRSELTRGGEFS